MGCMKCARKISRILQKSNDGFLRHFNLLTAETQKWAVFSRAARGLYAREVTDTRLISLIGPVCLILDERALRNCAAPTAFLDQFDPSGKGSMVGSAHE